MWLTALDSLAILLTASAEMIDLHRRYPDQSDIAADLSMALVISIGAILYYLCKCPQRRAKL